MHDRYVPDSELQYNFNKPPPYLLNSYKCAKPMEELFALHWKLYNSGPLILVKKEYRKFVVFSGLASKPKHRKQEKMKVNCIFRRLMP